MLADDSSGWQKLNSPDVRNLDAARLAETAAQKAVDSAHPREIAPGKYTVILEPAAVLDIVGFMFWDYSGVAILDQRSFLNDRIGTQLFGENINIRTTSAHPLQAGSPFDGEGMRRQRVQLVEERHREAGGVCAGHGAENEEVGVCGQGWTDRSHGPWISCCRMKWARCR